MRMILPAGVVLLACLAGCDQQPPVARRAAAAVHSPLDEMPDGPAPLITIKASFQCPRQVVEGEPTLPLDAPLTELQTLICAEPELSLLDRQVHEAYLAARLHSGVNRGQLSKVQAQWEANRDSCLKAADPRDCVAEASHTRLAEFALQDPATVARTQLQFTCQGTATPLTAAFYSRMRPAFAVLGFGGQQAIVFVQPTHVGLKYGRTGVDLFVLHGQVKAEFYGRRLACVLPSWRAPEALASVAAARATGAAGEQVEQAQPMISQAPTPKLDAAPVRTSIAAKAPAPVTATTASVAQVKPPSLPASSPPASAKAVATSSAPQASRVDVKKAVAPAPQPSPISVPPSATTKTPANVTAAQATDALAKTAVSAPAAPIHASAPVKSSPRASAKSTLTAAQATDALVRQVLAQVQASAASEAKKAPAAVAPATQAEMPIPAAPGAAPAAAPVKGTASPAVEPQP